MTLFEDRPWPLLDRYRIFVRVDKGKWRYMGLYKATKLPAWTPGEVKDQRATVRPPFFPTRVSFCFRYMRLNGLQTCAMGNWSTKVGASRWAHPTLARIMLREEFGREPTDEEVDRQIEKLKKRSVPIPPVDTINAAFENGEEVRLFL